MKIMVCGSIGFGGIEDIRLIQQLLIDNGYDVVDQISKEEMDYSYIDDFRDKKELAEEIINHDLKYIGQCDIIVVVLNRPSMGTAIEMLYAKKYSKTIILLAKDKVPTPWPIFFSDYIVKSKNELLHLLHNYNKSVITRISTESNNTKEIKITNKGLRMKR